MMLPGAPILQGSPRLTDWRGAVEWAIEQIKQTLGYLDVLRRGIESSFIRSEGTTWTPGLIANGAVAQTTVTVNGAALRMTAVAAYSVALPAGCFISAHVSAADTVTVTIGNLSGAGATPTAASTLRVDVFV